MDQKKVLRTGQQLRNSPRFKGVERKDEDELKRCKEETSSLINATSKVNATPEIGPSAPNTPNTPRTPTRKNGSSRNSTPSSTSMQRELRKIEDYWTRQEPIKPDSPRLRYPKRRDSVNEGPKSPSLQKPEDNQTSTPKVKENNDELLSESPIPKYKDVNHVSICSENTSSELADDEDAKEVKTDATKKRVHSANEQTNVSTEDYIPPRKKLRSEVKQDELWEGIPLTISFKRLTPLLRQNDDQQSLRTEKDSEIHGRDTIIESGNRKQSSEEDGRDKNKDVEIEKINTEKSVKRTEKPTFNEFVNDKTKNNVRNLFEDIRKPTISTNDSNPYIPQVKRNTRLQVKSQLLKKSIECIEKTQPIESLQESKQNDKSENEKIDDVELVTTTSIPLIQDNSKSQKCTHGLNETDKQKSYVLSSKENANETDDGYNTEALNRNEKNEYIDDMANMSISQILNCDSQNSIQDTSFDVPEVANTVEIELETSLASEREHETTELNVSDVSREAFQTSEKCSEGHDETNECSKDTDEKVKEEKITSKSKKAKFQHSDATKSISDNDMEGTGIVKKKQTTKLKETSPWFTLIKEGISEKSKKIPPLKIMLKSTKRKLRQIKARKDKNNKKSIKNKKKQIDNQKPSTSTGQTETTEETDKDLEKDKADKDDDQDVIPCTKRIKRNKLDRKASKISSPPSNLNLRLNSERRMAMVNGLLSNKVLNNHACLIWSSENRRHMQLSHPKASTAELDNLLREKWSQLCEKEKLKYLQRAWHASKDENKHSSRRHDPYQMQEDQQQEQPGHPSIERFLKMSSKNQHQEIKQWLQFYYEVSPEMYFCVINQFRDCLQTEKQDEENLENARKQKTKTKKSKTKKTKQLPSESDADAKHRRLMFEAILGYQKEVLETWADKKETQAQILRDNFNNLVKKLVIGEKVDLTKNVKSSKLTETLQDLKELEKEKKLIVSGESINDNTYATLLNELDDYTKDKKGNFNLLKSLENVCVDHDKVEEYLTVTNKMDGRKMPILNCIAIKHVLDNVCPKTKRQRNLSIFKKQTTLSPASMMTEWVADDVITANPNVDFRQAGISLLTHKVRKRPAILSIPIPEKSDVTSTSSCNRKMQSILASNRNQNCYKTVTYTFSHDQNSKSIISKLKRLKYDKGHNT